MLSSHILYWIPTIWFCFIIVSLGFLLFVIKVLTLLILFYFIALVRSLLYKKSNN